MCLRISSNQYFTFYEYIQFLLTPFPPIHTHIWSLCCYWLLVFLLFTVFFSGKRHTSHSNIAKEKAHSSVFSSISTASLTHLLFLQRAFLALETELFPLPLRSWHSICIALICPAQKEEGKDVRDYLLQFKVSFLLCLFLFSLPPPPSPF